MTIRPFSSAERRQLESHLLSEQAADLLRADLAKGAWLDQLIPEIRAEMDFLQRTHYHAYTNLEHSIRTMAAMPTVLDERIAGLFHDIGKRRTTTIKERNGEEQYLGHAPAGASMVKPILARIGYDSARIERISRWIFWHMELHLAANNGQSPKAQAKLLAKIERDLEVLKRLQLADIGAMNPQLAPTMRQSALAYHRMLDATIAGRGDKR